MDRQRLRDMHLLDETRIGHEQKQAYQDWLAQLSAEGYLTADEYSARMDWLFQARTEEEMKVVFKDLPRLKPTGMEPANPNLRPVTPKKRFNSTSRYAAIWFGIGILMSLSDAMTGHMFLLVFSVFITVIWGLTLIMKFNDK